MNTICSRVEMKSIEYDVTYTFVVVSFIYLFNTGSGDYEFPLLYVLLPVLVLVIADL